MKKEFEASSGLEPVELSPDLFKTSLSPEVATQGEIEALVLSAEKILEHDCVVTTMNGIPAEVSSTHTEVILDDKRYYARVFRLIGKKGEDKPLPGIVFDETVDTQVLTPNPFAVRFTSYAEKNVLFVDNGLDPYVNDPKYVETVKGILIRIGTKSEELRLAKKEEEDRIAEGQRNARKYRNERIKEGAVLAGQWILGLSALGVAGTGVVYGISKIELPKHFDEKGHELEGGTEIPLGSSGTPEFSAELYEDSRFEPADIPDLGNAQGDDILLEVDNIARDIWIMSSEDGKNCESRNVDKVPLDTKLVAWTDAVDATGNSRAEEFEVIYETEELTICWNGEEKSDDDDPRVVVSLRPASEAKPR